MSINVANALSDYGRRDTNINRDHPPSGNRDGYFRYWHDIAFLPPDIAGLQLWLKADAGLYQDSSFTIPADADGDVVGGWKDQSGEGNDVIQATTANKPMLKLSILNGQPVIRFDGTDDWLRVSSVSLSQPNTIIVAFQISNLTGVRTVFDGVTDAEQRFDAWAGNFRFFAGSTVNIKSSSTDSFILSIIADGASSEAWFNGSSIGTFDPGTNGLSGISIGSNYTSQGNNEIQGDIPEFLLFDSGLSNSDRQQVEEYLSDRFGIALS